MRTAFADPHMTTAAYYRKLGTSAEFPVRVALSRKDVQQGWSDAALVSDATILTVPASQIGVLSEGDVFRISGQVYVVQGQPIRDEDQLSWQAEIVPQ